jgi:hypothetical protein
MKKFWIVLATAGMLMADFRYEQTTRVTKGMVTKMTFGKKPEPTTTTTYMKGGRVATVDKASKSILDFDKELMTVIDLNKRQYWQLTFAEMKQAMEDMQAEVQKAGNSKDASVGIKFDAKATGLEKEVSGFSARQVIFTIEPQVSDGKQSSGAMKVVADSWHSEVVPGYSEYKAFYDKLKDKGGWMNMGSPMAGMNGQKGMAEGMRKLAEEMQKTPGIAVLTITRLSMPGMNMSASDSGNSGGGEAPSMSSVLGGALGGKFGGFGRKKKEDPKPVETPAPTSTPAPAGDGMLFMESFTDASGFSNAAIGEEVFQIPADFARVESPMTKMRKR